jgi:hypothetical protein
MLRVLKSLFAIITATIFALSSIYSAEARERDADITAASSLRPGQFIWHRQESSAGPIEIVVSLPQQRAYVFRGESLIGVSTVSSGRPGYDTPTGSYAILQKARFHRSNLYEDAPMPFMQRLTWDGLALHAGAVPDHPASHGCIRLPPQFARDLFAMTGLGAAVHIIAAAPDSPEIALAMVRAGAEFTGMGGPDPEIGPRD